MTYARTRLVLVVAAFVLMPCGGRFVVPVAHAHTDIYLSFRADLAPYGEWSQYGGYGWVWRPHRVRHGWRPYVDGHWVLTDAGWTWVADEPWGWAPYHYGRWFYDAGYGWGWVPGDEWAPAWVSWRRGNGIIGWAPLPPWAVWSGGGIAGNVYVEPAGFTFVEDRYFVAPHLGGYILPVNRSVTVWNETRNITNYRLANDRVVNRSLDSREIERAVGHQIAPRRLETLHAAAPRAIGPRAQVAEHGRGRAGRIDAQRAAHERSDRGRGHVAARPERREFQGGRAGARRENDRAATASRMRHGGVGRERGPRTVGRGEQATHGGRERMVREHGPARVEQRRAERRPAAEQRRAERRPAAEQRRAERRPAAEQRRAERRPAAEQRRAERPPTAGRHPAERAAIPERRHDVQAARRPTAAPRAERRAEGSAGRVEHRVQGTAPAVAGRGHGGERQATSGGQRATNRRPANKGGRGQAAEGR